MNYQTFETKLREEFEKYYPVKVGEFEKYGYGRITAFQIITDEHGKCFPVVYPSFCYEKYKEGGSVADIVLGYVASIEEAEIRTWHTELVEHTYDEICKYAIPSLFHKPLFAKGIGVDVPWSEDIIKAYTLRKGDGTVVLTEELLSHAKVSVEELEKIANKNLENTKFYVEDFAETIARMMGEDVYDRESLENSRNRFEINGSMRKLDFVEDLFFSSMFVVSTEDYFRGACVLLREDILRDLAVALGNGYFIIPSSIHEVIVIPKSKEGTDIKTLREMVCEVNENDVHKSDWLSSNVYYFNGNILEQC